MTPAQRKVVGFLIGRNAPVAVLDIPGDLSLVRSVVDRAGRERSSASPC